MTKARSAQLDTTWIRYRIPMLLYLRLKLHARRSERSMAQACVDAIAKGLNTYGIPHDPAALLGTEE